MNRVEWAKHEVDLICRNSDSYVRNCHYSALKAYEVLMEDGHCGNTFDITKDILWRLMNDLPLTPIEDTEEVWKPGTTSLRGVYIQQCKRMPSLFKDTFPDGTVQYSDVDRYIGIYMDIPRKYHHGRGCSRVLDQWFPIQMPYYPSSHKYKIYTRSWDVTDGEGAELSTTYFSHIITPDGDKAYVCKFYGDTATDDWRELTREEWQWRVKILNERRMEKLVEAKKEEVK